MKEKIMIVIIEDKANGLKDLILNLGYEVTGVFPTAACASDHIAETPPDLIVLNIEKTTDESANQLMSQYSIPVISICADDMKQVAEPHVSISKPVQDRQLQIAIEFALYKKRMTLDKTNLLAELSEVKGQLKKIDQEFDSFIHMASHDLRSPLQSIATYTGILQDYIDTNKPDEEITQFMERIFSNIRIMGKLIEDFVHTSRLSRAKNRFEQVDPKTIIKKAVERLEPDIKTNKAKITLPKSIPPVICDRTKLTEVFYNLIGNAIKFSSKTDTKHPEITVSHHIKDNLHTFCVTDNGIGIDLKYHDKIFNPFIRLHSKDEYPGSGLGLYLVKSVVDEHKGSVWFESVKYGGTSFYFTIPFLEPLADGVTESRLS